MFSSAEAITTYTVVRSDDEVDVDLTEYLAQPRADVDVRSVLPPRLCREFPSATHIVLARNNGEVRDFRCD